MIRRRHVIYVEGYDPQGAEGYYRLFSRSGRRFSEVWPLEASVSELQVQSQEFACWEIEASGPNWQVSTRYDFLRQEHIVRANLSEPLPRQLRRALGWALDYVVSGTLLRVFRASASFGVVLVFFQLMLLSWIVLALASGWLAGHVVTTAFDLPGLVAVVVGVPAALVALLLTWRFAAGGFVIQINNHWPYLCEFACNRVTCFDAPIEAGAQRLVAAAHANEADELVVVGHSGGGALAPAVVARALALDADVGRRGPALVLLTLGSIAPGAALHPAAERLHAEFARLAVEPSVRWIDAQSRADVLNFWDFDPVGGVGARVIGERCNPWIWKVSLGETASSQRYVGKRSDAFRLHYQFIMAAERRATYDYFMLVCGPLSIATWAADAEEALALFEPDGSLSADRRAARVTADGATGAP